MLFHVLYDSKLNILWFGFKLLALLCHKCEMVPVYDPEPSNFRLELPESESSNDNHF